jgi:hypothetical protein
MSVTMGGEVGLAKVTKDLFVAADVEKNGM